VVEVVDGVVVNFELQIRISKRHYIMLAGTNELTTDSS
jgi:hypothetical protein